jgi:cellulose synthase/poly-beta-1,6-N-acetylglucosamine synthase-like glycosyltransferase
MERSGRTRSDAVGVICGDRHLGLPSPRSADVALLERSVAAPAARVTTRVDAPPWATSRPPGAPRSRRPRRRTDGVPPPWWRWWLPGLAVAAVAVALLGVAVAGGGAAAVGGARWWLFTAVGHLPLLVVLFFLVGGLIERIGYFWRGRTPARPGRLPLRLPTVCVQLPMFNEHAVARRAIEAAAALVWPPDRLSIQVLDDSTDTDTRAMMEAVCAEVRASTGIDCRVLHRVDRHGYKAGALEVGRLRTDAEFLAIFDADFVPPRDYLLRTIRHFYLPDDLPDHGLALVQAQWGHLNHDESALTRAQSLWVDDHHTVQMSWRSARWRFVNFTGTAGVWRASAIEAAGGWRAASLVEDCELSFRHLFAGYRTTFVKEIVVPAELPATYTAYKAQQKRWTQGWVQLQRMHLRTLATRHPAPWPRRLHLLYHMCISWQWPAWALWIMVLPFLIHSRLWFGAFGTGIGLALYLVPTALWTVVAATVASVQTRHTYPGPLTPATLARRIARVVPYTVINIGMLPHQFSAFAEGLFGRMHSEFERTPKAGSGSTRRYRVRVHWPYVLTEAFFVTYQLSWAVLLAARGLYLCAAGAAFVAGCVLALAWFYGDHDGRRCFVLHP